MRAIAMSVEMAYSVNNEGLWVNLYGDNTVKVALPDGGALECRQISKYPWEGNVQLILTKVESEKPFSIFLRIPGWVDESVRIALNGDVTEVRNTSSTYYRLHRQWKTGDTMEMELPMTVRFMVAHPNVVDDWGKVAVMRGPVVYCLEGCDIPEGTMLETIYVPSNVELQPVFTEDLGGVMKLTGELVHSTTTTISRNKLVDDATETALYREVRFAEGDKKPAGKDRYVRISMIPYYTRLNRKSDYFRIWLPICGHKEAIATLIAKRAHLDTIDSFSNVTALSYAAERGNKDVVEVLIACGADVNAKRGRYPVGDTPLHSAVGARHRDIVELLIANKADVNAKNVDGQTALHYATIKGHKEIAELLITGRADVNATNSDGDTPLHHAVRIGRENVVELLIANGADINIKNDVGQTPMDIAISRNRSEVVKLLISRGMDVSIHMAARFGALAKVKSLIEKEADINAKDSSSRTALHYAVENGHKDVVELLIASGADVNVKDRDGNTPGYVALSKNNEAVLDLLIAKGANIVSVHLSAYQGELDQVMSFIEKGTDVNTTDSYGTTPLHYAAVGGSKEVVEFLVAKGANVNAKDKRNYTPLHRAAGKGHKDVAALLIDNGADVNARGRWDYTPIYYAVWSWDTETAEFLIEKGADVNAKDEWGWTPLHEAAAGGNRDMVEVLIAKCAEVNVKTNGGETALSVAKRKGHIVIVELLRKHRAKE